MEPRMALVSRASQNWCRPTHRYPPSRCTCLTPDDPPKRPDPAIYSQAEQLSLGVAPTWNPDDITTNQQRPWKLLLESTAVVRNLSTEASAINTLVHFYHVAFRNRHPAHAPLLPAGESRARLGR